MSTEAKVGAFTVLGIVLFAAVAVLLSGVSLGGGKDYMVYAGFKEASFRRQRCGCQAFPSGALPPLKTMRVASR